MPTAAEKRARFRELHESGCFVLPNPWDAGSARTLQGMGFKAVASTSSGAAWAAARLDNETPLEEMLAHLQALCDATDIPVNADFENAYADAPEDVAANVKRALATGIAGVSVEDMSQHEGKPLYDEVLAVERVKAARAAVDEAAPEDVNGRAVLVARAEGLLIGQMDLKQTLDRLVKLADAGADCLYAPGLRDAEQIAACVRAVAPKPVNVLVGWAPLSVDQLADLGVRRVSVGGSLARAAWGGFIKAARQIAEEGRFDLLSEGASGKEIAGLLKG